jgi:hypothetical protein
LDREAVSLQRRLKPENARNAIAHRIGDGLNTDFNLGAIDAPLLKHTSPKRNAPRQMLIAVPVLGSTPSKFTDISTIDSRNEKKNPTANARP